MEGSLDSPCVGACGDLCNRSVEGLAVIRHLAELSAFVLLFTVGIGLMAAFVIGLLLIWKPTPSASAVEDAYRRVEDEGRSTVWGIPVEYDDRLPESVIVINGRPYNWATREPMVWSEPNA